MGEPVAPLAPPRRRWTWWLGLAVATGCVSVLLRTFDSRAVFGLIGQAKPGWLAAAVLANLAVLPLLTEQCARLVPAGRAVRRGALWDCLVLAVAGMNTLPFGGGHALGVGLLATRGGLGLDGALSLLALEQLCEGFAKFALLLLALAAAPLPESLRRAAWILGAVLLAGAGALFWLARRPAAGAAMDGWRARWMHHFEALASARVFAGALGLGLAMKLAQLGAIYAVERSLGVELPLSTLALVLAAVSFATMLSVAPANLGIFEAAAFAAYRWLGVPPAEAMALAIVQHTCFLLAMVGPGYALTLWRAIWPAR